MSKMPEHIADGSVQCMIGRREFGRYVLDIDRGCLLMDDNEVGLRPKTFAVLQFLVANAGRLVSKDEIFAAVWTDIAVTDDVLVQSISELRRAFGDDGQRFIRTVPRRGYRFEAVVSNASQAPAVQPGSAQVDEPGRHSADETWANTKEAQSPQSTALFRHALARSLKAILRVMSIGASGSAKGELLNRNRLALVAVSLGLLGVIALWVRSAGDARLDSALSAKPAIAVLPFSNLNEEDAGQYYVDGITQDVINRLGRFSSLTVMSWNAVAEYKRRVVRPTDIAKALGVRYLVEGAVHRTSSRIEVSTQLVDPAGRVIWSSRYDEALADLFGLQERVTIELAGALAVRLTDAEQLRARLKPARSLDAYDFVLRARPALRRPSRTGIVEARGFLKRALEFEPANAMALAALADTYHIDAAWGWTESPATTLDRADALAREALRLDDTEQLAHVTLGRIDLFYNHFEQAKAEMEQAIAINPSDAQALAGRGNILMWLGQADAAIQSLELAQRIDPELNAVDRFSLSMAYYLERQYDRAVAQAEQNLRNAPSSSFSYVVLSAALAQLGRRADATRAMATLLRLDPTFDPDRFGTKFQNQADLAHLREGLRKAGFYEALGHAQPPGK